MNILGGKVSKTYQSTWNKFLQLQCREVIGAEDSGYDGATTCVLPKSVLSHQFGLVLILKR